ncbi:MAG: hypothetical protein LBJ96_01685 [Holosporaceae bacterium]|jgi:hypothetical protein|nr:hypothetical protein [Holosporaceae bacterium]
MGRLFFILFVLWEFSACGVPIETPELDERNEFVIKAPEEWGYRTFVGKNGLIGVLWPRGTSFNSTDTAIFVFLQTEGVKLPKKPDNINLFTEKCQKAKFMFSTGDQKKKSDADDDDDDDATLSIAEEYFSGRCGRTEILFKEVIDKYTIVVFLASGKYISKKQLADAKKVAANYRKEIEKYVKNSSVSDSDEEKEES